MLFVPLASGSKGNAYYCSSAETGILIDFGISLRKGLDYFSELQIDPSTIDGLFVTHAHADHMRSVPAFYRRFDTPVYASKKTIRSLRKKISGEAALMEIKGTVQLRDLRISSFQTYHDKGGSVGFTIFDGVHRVTIITDTGKFDGKMKEFAEQSQVLVLESNYDKEMLWDGSYPAYIKARIDSDYGHLSNESAIAFLDGCNLSHLQVLYVGHVSENNNSVQLATGKIEEKIREKGLIEVGVYLAHQHKMSKPFYSSATRLVNE